MKSQINQKTSSTGRGKMQLMSLDGCKSFFTAFGNGGSDMFFYTIRHDGAREWETGTGHLENAATLVRDTVIASSNHGAPVAFSPGDKSITNDLRDLQ